MLAIDKRTVFLVDAVGAVLSAVFLGLVLPKLHHLVGMPVPILHALSLLALLFATYSACCFAFADHTNPFWLRLIITTNLAYCALTLVLVGVFFHQLTALGVAYFVAEMIVIVALVSVEKRVLRALRSRTPEE